MNVSRVDVQTPDGAMDCHLFAPRSPGTPSRRSSDASRQWPAVIMYMDAFGIRPQLAEMAQRLASNGYFVALPNLYYRSGSVPPFDRQAVLVDGPERDRFKGMIQSIDSAKVMRDTGAVIARLGTTNGARIDRMGVVGYCMGGGYALAAAGTFPDRIAAAASFHGGSLATDKADSPHTLAPRIRAKVYVGAAEIDASFPSEQKERLARALLDAGVDHTLEVYAGAKHGFAVTGHLVYDREASETHWMKLIELFERTLH